jgi:mono/diheme cytochrome c family protein
MSQHRMTIPGVRIPPRRRPRRFATIALWVCVAGAAACEGASTASSVSSRYTDAAPPAIGQGGGSTTTTGLPCPVAAVLGTYCLSCHSSPPQQGVPVALVSYADLAQSSPVDPSATVAQRAVTRMQDTQSPMPPGAAPSVPAADIATLQSWVDSGMPTGDCSADAGTNPFDAPAVCSSGRTWNSGEDGEDLMHPGRACISCHIQNGEGEAPIFAIAGTVYPTPHEPDECLSTSVGGAVVEIHDADGHAVNLSVNANGNFTYTQAGFAYPYTAKVLYQGRERAMGAVQTSGDCNGCHTQQGSQSAPGRILLP